jgi:dihydrofolate reductase / thymidylate synthase
MRACAYIIVAMDTSRGIGKDGQLPWPKLEKDMEFFAERTKNCVVIMGRKTWDSLPRKNRPLKDRINYVLSKSLTTMDMVREYGPRCAAFTNLTDALLSAQTHYPDTDIFIMGGGEIYKEALDNNVVKGMFITEIQSKFDCDVRFPVFTQFEKVQTSDTILQEIKTGDAANPVAGLRYQIHTYKLNENLEETAYLALMARIAYRGYEIKPENERTGTGTRVILPSQLSFNLENQFPLLTSKKTFLRGIFEELKWFISGQTNVRDLKQKGVKIWDADTCRESLDQRGFTEYPEGELGPGYGFQWRHFGANYTGSSNEVDYTGTGIDQLQNVIDAIKEGKPASMRRLVVSAWNPSDMKKQVLPPCHLMFMFNVIEGKLHTNMIMRSTDVAVGLPFNIASYALLTCIMAKITKLKPGSITIQMSNPHLYNNHLELVKTQTDRTPFPFPTLIINKSLTCLDDVKDMVWDDLHLEGYHSHPAIPYELNVGLKTPTGSIEPVVNKKEEPKHN